MKTRLLSRKDIEGFFTMRLCMEAVEKAFADLATGNAAMPQQTPIAVPDQHGIALFMPAHIKSLGALGAKVVTVYKDNVARHNLPTVLGTIILLDEATGFPIALMDGGYLTAMRTGAVSGVATKYMARPEAKVAALFGTGVQAFTQVLGVHEARPLTKLLAYSIDPPEARTRFARKITEQIGVPVELADDPAAAASAADIIILATTASTPIVDGRWFAAGTHINGVGSHAPKARELDSLTVQKSRVGCDLTAPADRRQATSSSPPRPANGGGTRSRATWATWSPARFPAGPRGIRLPCSNPWGWPSRTCPRRAWSSTKRSRGESGRSFSSDYPLAEIDREPFYPAGSIPAPTASGSAFGKALPAGHNLNREIGRESPGIQWQPEKAMEYSDPAAKDTRRGRLAGGGDRARPSV